MVDGQPLGITVVVSTYTSATAGGDAKNGAHTVRTEYTDRTTDDGRTELRTRMVRTPMSYYYC